MRRLLLIAVGLTAVSAPGCVVGDGTGSAAGPLWITGCLEGDPYGTPNMPQMYDLQPRFFAGEPIEDLSTPSTNRLIIRMARTGNALEITDTLYFDVPNSGEVAACLRGQTVNGVPLGWDNTPTGPTGSLFPGVTGPWCEPPVAPPEGSGLPRIHLVPHGPVMASFTPFSTCVSQQHQPAIVSITGVARDGWIDFLDFGTAYDNATPPDMRHPVGDDFKIDFGQRLRANFHIILDDDRVVTAEWIGINPPPPATIGGTLDGIFDFDLERGQGAQDFP